MCVYVYLHKYTYMCNADLSLYVHIHIYSLIMQSALVPIWFLVLDLNYVSKFEESPVFFSYSVALIKYLTSGLQGVHFVGLALVEYSPCWWEILAGT